MWSPSVSEAIFSYCGVKIKIDTDRHLGPETAAVRANGEVVGHVTTAEYGSQMLSLGGVPHLTGGSKVEGPGYVRRPVGFVQLRARGIDGRWWIVCCGSSGSCADSRRCS